jgi:hypothetical protein
MSSNEEREKNYARDLIKINKERETKLTVQSRSVNDRVGSYYFIIF